MNTEEIKVIRLLVVEEKWEEVWKMIDNKYKFSLGANAYDVVPFEIKEAKKKCNL